MRAIRRTTSTVCFLLISIFAAAQRQAPPAPPQTPRQALIDIINGGPAGISKHLTVEVQQLLNRPENKSALAELGMVGSIKSEWGKNFQLFETGPVLLSFDEPRTHQKIEVHVNNDDMSGDLDTLELSVHVFQDGEEVHEEWEPYFSHLNVTLIQQQGIWRLSKVGTAIEFAIGDPAFLKQTLLKSNQQNATASGSTPESHSELVLKNGVEQSEMKPEQLAQMLGLAEQTYAHLHADAGFTCSLTELADVAKTFGVDSQAGTGSYKGYRINLSGCQGHPTGSFQITVEPMTTGNNGKAYCVDATQNLRVSDDGRGATCLVAGRADVQANEDDSVGVNVVFGTKPKEKE